jgi:hypothetical protein
MTIWPENAVLEMGKPQWMMPEILVGLLPLELLLESRVCDLPRIVKVVLGRRRRRATVG